MSQQPLQHRPVASVPANQLEQAMTAMEALGNLQQATLLQPDSQRPVTGEWDNTCSLPLPNKHCGGIATPMLQASCNW